MITDPISDMLTRVRNGLAASRQEIVMPYSKFKKNLADVLSKEGFIGSVSEVPGRMKMLQIVLKYGADGSPVIQGVQRISKPGQRMYVPAIKIPRTNGGLGITVVSTSKGLLTDKQARKQQVGGELICQVW